jgi:protein-S-isoprenylcysteine O-methyltransferase Ste14
MVTRPPKILKWLSLFAAGLLLLGAFAPISDPLDRILSGVGTMLLLVYLAIAWWENRRARQADQSSSAAISSSDQT